jgi:hypothetical protein
MALRFAGGAFFLLACTASALAQGKDNPLSRAVPPTEGAHACFSRTYDGAHLKQHPRQMTQSVLLSLRYEDERYVVRIMLRQNKRPLPLSIVGSCGWSAKANLGVDDKPLVKAFTSVSGLDCAAFAAMESDVEGGDFPIDLADDGKTLTLYLVDRTSAWSGTNQNRKTSGARLGKDDLTFRLDRVEAAGCREMEKALRAK